MRIYFPELIPWAYSLGLFPELMETETAVREHARPKNRSLIFTLGFLQEDQIHER